MTAAVFVLGAGLVPAQEEQQPDREERVFEAEHFWRNECASCHGQQGEGVDELRSPALAGLPDYYVMDQIRKFRHGLRNPGDDRTIIYEMHREAVELDDDLFRRLAELIAALPVRRPELTVIGNPRDGKQPYQELCAGCHGEEAEGNSARNAPPLYGFQDWYLVEQIRRFKLGQRMPDAYQADSRDMHAMAIRFDRMQDMRDIATYINLQLEGQPDAEP